VASQGLPSQWFCLNAPFYLPQVSPFQAKPERQRQGYGAAGVILGGEILHEDQRHFGGPQGGPAFSINTAGLDGVM